MEALLARRLLARGVTFEDFATVGNRVADDTTKAQAAITRAGEVGVPAQFSKRHIVSGLTIPAHSHLTGSIANPEQRAVTDGYYAHSSQLCLSAGTTISPGQGATLSNAVLTRAGQISPPTNDSECATLLASFAGTAVTAPNTGTLLRDLIIVGHEYGIDINPALGVHGRADVKNVKIDCINGIRLANSLDICRFRDVHCWPFTTVHIPGTSSAQLLRSGTAFHFDARNDWSDSIGGFSYGYVKGVTFNNTSNITLVRHQVDTANSAHSTHGYHIAGTSEHIRLDQCTAIGPLNGIVQETTDTFAATIVTGGLFANPNACFNIVDGDFIAQGCSLQAATYGVYIGPNAGNVTLSGLLIDGCTNGIYVDAGYTGRLIIDNPRITNCTNRWVIPNAVRDFVTITGVPDTYHLLGAGSLAKAATASLLDVTVMVPKMTGLPTVALTTSGVRFVSANGGAVTSSGSTLTFTEVGDRYVSVRIDGFSGLTVGAVGWITTDCLRMTST